jgi:hypothetical protein
MRSGDPWLVSCAMASAAELKIRDVAPDIREVGELSGHEVAEVARSAGLALA